MTTDSLADLTRRLEDAATRLRGGDLEPAAAAALVEECAQLAAQAGAELDRQSRAAAELPLTGTEQLPLEGGAAAQP